MCVCVCVYVCMFTRALARALTHMFTWYIYLYPQLCKYANATYHTHTPTHTNIYIFDACMCTIYIYPSTHPPNPTHATTHRRRHTIKSQGTQSELGSQGPTACLSIQPHLAHPQTQRRHTHTTTGAEQLIVERNRHLIQLHRHIQFQPDHHGGICLVGQVVGRPRQIHVRQVVLTQAVGHVMRGGCLEQAKPVEALSSLCRARRHLLQRRLCVCIISYRNACQGGAGG